MESTEELKQSQYVDWHLLKLPSECTKTKVKDFEVWKAKIKGMLNKVKSSKLEQIKGTAKLKEADQHIVDAFLIVLGYKTKEDRKQALKDFRASKIDLLKQTKFVKFDDFTFEDCKQIQNLLADFINNKTESIADLYKDLAKWVVNLVYIKIATARVQMRSDFIKREGIADLKLSDENIDELRYDYTLDWSVIGYIEYKGSYYESSEHHDLKDDIDFSTKRPPEEVINFYNFLLELYGKNTDQSWDDTTSFTTHTKTIDECLVEDSIFNLTYAQMKSIKAFYDKYPDFDSMNISSSIIKEKYTKLKYYFNCRMHRELHGRAAIFHKHSGWEKLIFTKTEDECTGENFSKCLENTYALVKDYSETDLYKGLEIYEFDLWDRNDYIDSDALHLRELLSIFIKIMNSKEEKSPDTFNEFDMNACKEELPQTKSYSNKLCKFKPEYLTFEKCLVIQEKYDKHNLRKFDYNTTAYHIYDYIEKMVQLRIALGVFGEKTGYTIIKEDSN